MSRHRPPGASASTAWVAAALFASSVAAFAPPPVPSRPSTPATLPSSSVGRAPPPAGEPGAAAGATSTSTSTSLPMVFDFFRKRSAEGMDQLSNLADAASRGKLGEGLLDAAVYARQTNEAFAVGLAKSRNRLLYDLEAALSGGGDVLEDLEDALLQADLGLGTVEDVLGEVRSLREDSTDIFSRDDLRSVLRGKLIEALEVTEEQAARGMSRNVRFEEGKSVGEGGLPTVLFVMGANGMGKTTTIGKLASRLRTEGQQKVLVSACDTFRAGAVEQLEMWADRAEVDCYSPNESQKSPAAVLYGSLDAALSGGYDTVIVDTSGRLSNNDALTAELAKMKRVIQKRLSVGEDDEGRPLPNVDVPHETLLVIDAAQGRMALESARQWNEEIGLTGLVLTKLDGSARGGSVVAVSRELGLPVKLIGVGEGIDDLRDFDPEAFVDGLLGIGSAGASKGSKGKSDEGKVLAARLTEMRKARDERAKTRKADETQKEKIPVGVGGGGPGPAGELTFQEMGDAAPTPVAANGGGPGPGVPRKPKNKNKKKKKRKGRR